MTTYLRNRLDVVVVVLLVLWLLATMGGGWAEARPLSPTSTYTYAVFQLCDASQEYMLQQVNDLGAQGWRLVTPEVLLRARGVGAGSPCVHFVPAVFEMEGEG